MDVSGVHLMMLEYEENVNVVDKINTELCKKFGLEHYLTEFSSNLIRALNQYKRFVMLMKDRKAFVERILLFSRACIHFFEANINAKEPQATLKKMNELVNNLNDINEMINLSFAESVKDYLKED